MTLTWVLMLVIFLATMVVGLSPIKQPAAPPVCRDIVTNGVLGPSASVGGTCAGKSGDMFVCGGQGNYVWARVPLGTADFTLTARLALETVSATAASIPFVGNGEDNLGLDFGGRRTGVEGVHWGASPSFGATSPTAKTPFNLTISRVSGHVTLQIDGAHMLSAPMQFPITTFGLRPWRSTMEISRFHVCASSLPPPSPPPRPPLGVVFPNGMAVPGMPGALYSFAIPALQLTPKGNLLAFCQANLALKDEPRRGAATAITAIGGTDGVQDGRGRWTDIALRRSIDGGKTWGPLQIICRNSTLGPGGKRNASLEHSCQQPAPVADLVAGKIILLSSLDNWYQRSIESLDDGLTWTPWLQAGNLDASLRKPGWGLVFNGLPGGIQLTAPSPHAGRLVVCSSAYWTGGRMVDGKIVNSGDSASRHSFAMLSDDHGATWRIGSKQIAPYHTTECSVAQSFDGEGALFMYTRIWAHHPGEPRRGIAKSLDGGETWDSATLRGLGDTAPDCEGAILSASVGNTNKTCFFVSAPWSASRSNLTVQSSCGPDAPTVWSAGTVVDPGPSSYSSLGWTPSGLLLNLYMSSGGISISVVPLDALT